VNMDAMGFFFETIARFQQTDLVASILRCAIAFWASKKISRGWIKIVKHFWVEIVTAII